MIEKTYGEAIYGYDFWSAALNESPYVLWLQKENSEEKLQLDIFNNINFGLPKVKIGVDQVIGLAGGVYSGLPTIENREFSFKTFFAGNDYKTALNAERIDYILNWFEYNKYEKMYLYWFVKDRLKTYRIEVRPSISGEQYNKYIIAKDVGISLIAEKSYFEAVEETEIRASAVSSISIINNGLDTPFVLEITPLESTSSVKVVNDKGAGFESYYSFPANKKIVIDTATGVVTLDGTVMNSFFSSGSLFNLARGTNHIYLSPTNCEFTIRYKERIK